MNTQELNQLVQHARQQVIQRYGRSLLNEAGERVWFRMEPRVGSPEWTGLETDGDGAALRALLDERQIPVRYTFTADDCSATMFAVDTVALEALGERVVEAALQLDLTEQGPPIKLKVSVLPIEGSSKVRVVADASLQVMQQWAQQKGFPFDDISTGEDGRSEMLIDREAFMDVVKAHKSNKWISAGGVVIHDMQADPMECYIIAPRNMYGGKPWTLPKGRVDEGETIQQAARREVFEETGLKAKIIPGSYLGSFKGSYSLTHYFMMVRVGGRPTVNDEVERIETMPLAEAQKLFGSTGNPRDAKVLRKAMKWAQRLQEASEANADCFGRVMQMVEVHLADDIDVRLDEKDMPAFMKHCVADLIGKGKDKSSAFAICTSTMQKAGYLKKGQDQREPTAKGKKAARRHSREPGTDKKLKTYKSAIGEMDAAWRYLQ